MKARRQDLETFVQLALGQKLEVYWCGQPARNLAEPGDLIVFGLVWAMLAGMLAEIGLNLVTNMGLIRGVALLLGCAYGQVDGAVGWGLWSILLGLGLWARRKWTMEVTRQTVYAIVPRRAVILQGFPQRRATVIALANMRQLTLRHETADMGTLHLGATPGPKFQHVRHAQVVFRRALKAMDVPKLTRRLPKGARALAAAAED